jgi:hypothetical protein
VTATDVAWLILSVAALGAVAEWRLHHNRTAIVADLMVALAAAAKVAVGEAVAEALRAERVNGQAIDALSEHVGALDGRIGAVEGALKGMGVRLPVPGEVDFNGG